MPIRTCIVSFTDGEGIRHSVSAQAAMLYEAAALAVRTFREHGCPPGPASRLDVEARTPSVRHTVSMTKIQEWLESSAKSPADKVTKDRLKGLLSS